MEGLKKTHSWSETSDTSIRKSKVFRITTHKKDGTISTDTYTVSSKSILSAYPLELIK